MRRSRGFTIVEVMMVCLVLSMLAALFVPRYLNARDKGSYTACQENLKNLSVALQSYANENHQVYPDGLAQLTPSYIKSMPTCPGGLKDTYTAGYEKNDLPAMFTLYCSGPNHLNVIDVPNEPYYIFGIGLGP
jgi:prepilin-type N-terminal cleavage/methylation domain-containing protein